jgi:hypothetical protein
VETLADNILYNDELLTIKAENLYLGAVTSKLSIEDATSLNPDNLVITLENGTAYRNDTLKVTARLPRGITTAKDITIALSTDKSKSNLNNLPNQPLFPSSVTIPGDSKTNFSEFNIVASNPNNTPANLVLNGTCVDCKVNTQSIAILGPKNPDANGLVAFNSDGKNVYRLNEVNRHPNNEVQIVNRWGVLVYQAKGYDNEKVAFRGRSNRGYIYDLPGGLYYYVVLLSDKKKKEGGVIQGSLRINRGNPEEEIGEIYFDQPKTDLLGGHW